MKIKLKGICIDIKKERSIEKLNTLIKICRIEQKSSSLPKKEFLQIIIEMVSKRIDHVIQTEPALEIV